MDGKKGGCTGGYVQRRVSVRKLCKEIGYKEGVYEKGVFNEGGCKKEGTQKEWLQGRKVQRW
jgi:hypothetical protein